MTASVFYAGSAEYATLTNTFSVSGTATDPTTVSLLVRAPGGTQTTYTYAGGDITKSATGVYTMDVACTSEGMWTYVWTGTGTASDIQAGSWNVFSTSLHQTYCTLEELKDARHIVPTDTVDDHALLQRLVRSARAIDTRCRGLGGHFYLDSTTSTMTYLVQGSTTREPDGDVLLVDDFGSSSITVQTGDGTNWTTVDSTGYDLLPDNAIARGQPITAVKLISSKWLSRYARVIGYLGWPSVPPNVSEANLLLANRRHFRRESPEGVAGYGAEGAVRVSRFDPDIEDLLEDYIKVA